MDWMKAYAGNCGPADDSRAPPWRAVVVASVLVVALYVDPAHARAGDIIWQGQDQAVVLAAQDDAGAPPNEHPVSLPPEEIGKMLSGLRFTHADQDADATPVAVFNKEQVQILGSAFATGLSRATPTQDVTFSIVGAHRLAPGAFALRNRLTSGRAFFRDGKLNVIFGDIQGPYRKKNIYGRLEEDFHPRKFGSRTASEMRGSSLVAGTDAHLITGSSGPRDDWIVFGASVADAAAPSTARPAPATPRGSDNDQRRLAVANADAEAVSSRAAKPAHPAPQETPDLERRLETLKQLRGKGLISEEIYRERVNEVLDEL